MENLVPWVYVYVKLLLQLQSSLWARTGGQSTFFSPRLVCFRELTFFSCESMSACLRLILLCCLLALQSDAANVVSLTPAQKWISNFTSRTATRFLLVLSFPSATNKGHIWKKKLFLPRRHLSCSFSPFALQSVLLLLSKLNLCTNRLIWVKSTLVDCLSQATCGCNGVKERKKKERKKERERKK